MKYKRERKRARQREGEIWELSVDMKDLRALSLVGPTSEDPVRNPLAVQHLDYGLYIK